MIRLSLHPRATAWLLALCCVAAVVAAAAAGCSSEPPAAAAPLPPASSSSGSIEGLTGLSVLPESAALTVAAGQTGTQGFTATGSFADGSSRDVTALVAWSTDVPGASVAEGVFSTAIPGAGSVTASAGPVSDSATIAVEVAGEISLPGAPEGAGGKLGGAPSAQFAPVVAYPLDGALFPANLGAAELQVRKGDPQQGLARIDFTGDFIDVKLVGVCDAIAGVPEGCALGLPEALVPVLAGASEAGDMQLRVRLCAEDGSALGESPPLAVSWTFTKVGGGLYYWTTRHNGATHIYRYDLDAQGSPPESFFSDAQSPPLHDGTEHPCVGCHAVSLDGKKIGLTFGGSNPSDFALLDVATGDALAVRNTDPLRTQKRPCVPAAAVLLLGVTASLAGCGGRTTYAPPSDGGAECCCAQGNGHGGSATGAGAAGPGGAGSGATGAGGGGTGAGATGGNGTGAGSPLDCLACIGQSCPDALACVQDPACLQGMICTVSNCMSGGQPDPSCALDCFGGDLKAVMMALQAIGCIWGSCGEQCAGLLPGAGG